MERRHFLKLAFGFAAGAGLAARAVTQAQAAPLLPTNPLDHHKPDNEPQPAVGSQDDVDRLHLHFGFARARPVDPVRKGLRLGAGRRRPQRERETGADQQRSKSGAAAGATIGAEIGWLHDPQLRVGRAK